MDYSSFIDLNALSEDARKELKSFYDYLIFKYKRIKSNKQINQKGKTRFTALQLDTKGFTFSREEANER